MIAAFALGPVPSTFSPATSDDIGLATFQNRIIDLKEGWQGAVSCVVLTARETRCFATPEEADAFLGYSRSSDPLTIQGIPACPSGWLCLYEDVQGGGRSLQFRDEYWQYLLNWGFDRKTSSWRNNQGPSDWGHLAMYNSSTVYNCAPQSYALSMGIYNDQAYAVWG